MEPGIAQFRRHLPLDEVREFYESDVVIDTFNAGFAGMWHTRVVPDLPGPKNSIAYVCSLLDVEASHRVLDFGCGVGDLAGVLYLGVFQVGLSYVLLTRSITHVPAVDASLLLLAEPALSPLWAWLLHGEAPGGWPLAGGVLIIGAAAWKAVRGGRFAARTHERR
jgi:hypothetical protein